MNLIPPELGSDKFARWAREVWPYIVGIIGLIIIFADCFLDPPGNPTTSGVGLGMVTGMGVIKLDRFRRNGTA